MPRKVDLSERVKKKLPKEEPFDKEKTNKGVLGILGKLGIESPVLPDLDEPEEPTYLSPSATAKRDKLKYAKQSSLLGNR